MLKQTLLIAFAACFAGAAPACAQAAQPEAASPPANPTIPLTEEVRAARPQAAPTTTQESLVEAARRVAESAQTLRAASPAARPRKVSAIRIEKPLVMEKGTFLGVTASPVPGVLRDQLQLRPGIGLVVDFVTTNSPAAAAGLKKNDVLERLGEQLLVNAQQLAVLVRTFKPGDEVQLAIIREAKPQTITVRLAEGDVPPLDEVTIGRPHTQDFEAVLTTVRDGEYNATFGPGGVPFTGKPIARRIAGDDPFGFVWSDKQHTFKISNNPPAGRYLIATDKRGDAVIFKGAINTDEELQLLPEEIRPKVLKLKTSHLDAATATTAPASPEQVGPPQP